MDDYTAAESVVWNILHAESASGAGLGASQSMNPLYPVRHYFP